MIVFQFLRNVRCFVLSAVPFLILGDSPWHWVVNVALKPSLLRELGKGSLGHKMEVRRMVMVIAMI